jgi:hypothetical protein
MAGDVAFRSCTSKQRLDRVINIWSERAMKTIVRVFINQNDAEAARLALIDAGAGAVGVEVTFPATRRVRFAAIF